MRDGPDPCLDRLLLFFWAHYFEDGPHLLCTGLLRWLPFTENKDVATYITEEGYLQISYLGKDISHTVGSLFILMLFSLSMQKRFILMRSHLFILSSLGLGDISVKMLVHGMSDFPADDFL